MRALRYDRFGGPEVLHVDDIAEPIPREGEVKVRVRAASLNPVDWKLRAGHMRWVPGFSHPPRTPGCDFAGEIVGVGGGAISHYVGERVWRCTRSVAAALWPNSWSRGSVGSRRCRRA
jgi:NADPH:quinone reductase-like Zn-dependent oxidoreductase